MARGRKKERVEDSEVSNRLGFGKTPLRKTLALNSGGERMLLCESAAENDNQEGGTRTNCRSHDSTQANIVWKRLVFQNAWQGHPQKT